MATTKSKAKGPGRKKQSGETAPKRSDDAQPMVVFAFRLTKAERELIHEVAGSAKASRFVRSAALAAATKDVDAFRAAIAEAEATKK